MFTKEREGVEWKEKNLGELLIQAGIAPPADLANPLISDICEDSRRVTTGALFVAVPGSKSNGVDFVPDALRRGAAAVVVGQGLNVRCDVPVIQVPDPRLAVAKIAAAFYGLAALQQSKSLQITGVTGTNGKSTFAFMLRHLFQEAGRATALFGTIEYDLIGWKLASDLTTPDAGTLTRHLVEAHHHGATHAVMEVSSHSLDQRRTDGIHFETAVFTNLTQDHLDYHKTLENYLEAKRRLFQELRPDATAIVNAHDPASPRMVQDCPARIIRYGFSEGCDVRGTILREDHAGGRFLLEYRGRHAELHTPMVGRHNILNALAAAAAAIASGLDLPAIERGLAGLVNVPGRLQRVDTTDLGFDVFVDYAHTDDALKNVLSALRPLTRGRLWCVFGCGGDRDRAKRPKMARAVAESADAFVLTSDNPRTEDPIAILTDVERGLTADERRRNATIPDRARAIAHVVERLQPGDVLVIAGKGHENYQIIGTTKHPFDDVQVASEAIARKQGQAACAR